jgi:hypothetical protein
MGDGLFYFLPVGHHQRIFTLGGKGLVRGKDFADTCRGNFFLLELDAV